MNARIEHITYHLPETVLTNAALAEEFPGWSASKALDTIGINSRHVADATTFSSDLAVEAARRFFAETAVDANSIDFLILCTQSPDYCLPTTACLVQARLGLPTSVGAFDINLGCSGYVYALSVAKGLIETGQARRILLITVETYSKIIHPGDRSLRSLFGDAAACTLVTSAETGSARIGSFVFGTDGTGAHHLISKRGGLRDGRTDAAMVAVTDEFGNTRTDADLFMDGPAVFNFTLRAVPPLVRQTLEKNHIEQDKVALFVFHQANGYILEALRKKLRIDPDRFFVFLRDCGNTTSSTIPIALAEAIRQGRATAGDEVLLAGFGVGYSVAGTVITL